MVKGQRVTLRTDGRTIAAEVVVASPNGRSLVLQFEAIVHGHVGLMPVFLEDDGKYRTLVGGIEIAIEAGRLH